MLLGDFNDIVDMTEKSGGNARAPWSFNDFKDLIFKLGAVDLGYRGQPWTWSCYRMNEGLIRERLDRILISLEWRLKYDHATVLHVKNDALDHVLILCSTEGVNNLRHIN